LATVLGKYSPEKAQAIRAIEFDRKTIASRGLRYERLDQLTVDLLLGMR
ncbi:MAG: xylose isomerase, partial [Chloroflexi bacterium]|nr:xylose isomerase [Chloroflexota bacterium]